MRPTGKLHLGNYMGALYNWVRLQDVYNCYFFIADWHALTTDYADTSNLRQNIMDVGLDWLAAGLDPEGAGLLRMGEHAVFRLAEPIRVQFLPPGPLRGRRRDPPPCGAQWLSPGH